MNKENAQQMLDKIIAEVFGVKNTFSLEQFQQKYAFDIKLPSQTFSSVSNQPTWTSSLNPGKFMTQEEIEERGAKDDWILPKRPVSSIADILEAWNEANYAKTEKAIDSQNLLESDMVIGSQNIYRSQDIINCKNILFSDNLTNSEFVVAGHRSNTSVFCARLEDSKDCSASFSVTWSKKIAKSMFINDCVDMFECLFCSHMNSKRFCIANMQFEEQEYYKIKQMVIEWVFAS